MASPTHHPDLERVSADDWAVVATLFDTSGQPLDLTAADLAWTLLGPDGLQAIDPNSATLQIASDTTTGIVTVIIPRAITATLNPARYTDALRVSIGGQSDLMFIGGIDVDADPFDSSTVPPGGWPS